MNIHIPAEGASAPIRIAITIPTNVYFLSGIRNFTLDMAKNVAGFDEQWAYRFQTVVDELTNNAIEYGSHEGEDIHLTFVIERQKSVEVTVSDAGHGARPTTADDLTTRAAEVKNRIGEPSLALRGRGFLIIGNWTDELTFHDNETGGISVTAKKIYQPEALEPHPLHAGTSQNVYVLEV